MFDPLTIGLLFLITIMVLGFIFPKTIGKSLQEAFKEINKRSDKILGGDNFAGKEKESNYGKPR